MARAKQRNRHMGEDGAGDELEMNEQELENGTRETIEAGWRHARAARRSVTATLDAFDMLGGPMTRMMEQNRAMLQKMVHAMQEESLKFVNRRLEHTSHAIECCRDCQGVSGLMAVQQEWMLDFARDYTEQTKRFTELVRELAEDGTATLSKVSSEVMERGRIEERQHRAAA